ERSRRISTRQARGGGQEMADISQGWLAHSVPLENENSQLALYDAKPLYTNSIKRCVDVGGAVALIILFFPIGLLIALVLLLCGGSIFFLHHRIGAEGRTFTCLKFRTMIADGDGQLALHLKEQPRAKAEWESH